MKIRSRALNKGERFCCSQKTVRCIFDDSDITIWFADWHRQYRPQKSDKCLKFDGIIIADLEVAHSDGRIGSHASNSAHLCFYVLKENLFSDNLEEKFIAEVLPQIYAKYVKHAVAHPGNIEGVYRLCVELVKERFILHEWMTCKFR